MIRRILVALSALWVALGPVAAADNTVILAPGVGVTMRSKDVGAGVQSMIQIPGDTSGNPLATAPGTPNAVFALPIQGVTGGTAIPVTGTITAITAITNALPAGTNSIGGVTPGTNALGLAASNASAPFATQLMVSDGSLLQRVFTPSQLGDAVNGNNMVAVGGWIWNGATWDRTPGTAANGVKSIVTNAGTFAVQATLAIETTKVIGTTRITGNIGGVFDIITGSAVPPNALYIGMNQAGALTGLTGTSGNLNVQCANCSGSGVSTADAAAFTAGASLFAGSGGFFQTTATNNALTNGQQGMLQMTANRAAFVNLRTAAGAEIGVAAAPVQVSLANTAANGTAVLVTGTAGTFPVTGTFFQATQPVSLASAQVSSGAYASGAFASGAFASGSVASGAFASGALASGSIAAGAQVDLLTMRGTKGNGTAAANSMLTGAVNNTTQPTVGNGEQAALQSTTRGELLVALSNGAAAAAITTAGADGVSNTLSGLQTYARTQCFNGSTWDRCTNIPTGTAGAASATVVTVQPIAGGNNFPVINGANAYETVAASQTAQALGATGATGDYLSHCIVIPATTTPGVVTILDNATTVVGFPGGASSVSNLVPFIISVGAISVSGAWKITTGANVSVACVGKFT